MPASPQLVSCRFGLETNTQRFVSPLTKAVQRVVLAGSRWTLEAKLPRMNRAQASVWQAFFLQLEGSANTFYGFDPDAKRPRGAGGGTPLVKGGSQTGSSLDTDGWPNNTVVLLPGDYFAAGSEMKMVTAPVLSNGSGEATIPFKPAWRSSPADNAPLTINNPTCTMILADDFQAMWDCDKNGIYEEKTFSAFEVFA
jgi:hypothetical protein